MPNFTVTRTLSQAASVFVIFVGCIVLIGWIVDIALLKSVLPGLVTMKANTAIAFLLSGVSLWLLLKTQERKRGGFPISPRFHVLIAQSCAIAVMLFGLLTLCQYLFGWNIGIDELLFRDLRKAVETSHQGRMGTNTAGNFVLIGVALWLLGQKTYRCYWLAQGLTLVVALISLQAFIGYAYGVRNFYQFGAYTTSMALHTALTFGVLCLGVLYTRPNHGFMQTITSELNGGAIARLLIPNAIVLPLAVGWLILQGQRAKQYDSAFSISLLVVSLDVMFLALIWRNATFLNKLDSNRKQAEAALRQSEERYRLLAENVPQMVWMTNADGLVEYFNQRWLDYTGLKIHETLGWDWQQVVHPDDLPTAIEKWTTGLQTGNRVEVQYRLRRVDGAYRWHIAQALPLRDEGGTIIKWFGTSTDIDDQKRSEQALRQSEARLRLFVESDIIGIHFGDVYGGVSEVNDAYLRIVGYTRKDFQQGRVCWRDITPPEYIPLDEAAIAEAKEKRVCIPYEKEYIRKDGTRVPVLIGFTLIGEKREEAIAFILDLSDRKRAEAALIESEQRFRYVTDTAPMMVWMSGKDKLFNYFNKPWLDFTGRTMEQELGNGWLQGVHPDDFLRCLERYTHAFDARQDFRMEYRLQRFDGEYRWILDIGVPRFTPEGEFLGYIGSCIDIENRKQAEAQIRQLNETLEERVKQRTSQLEAANKELESFSYSVSHDLRAPLRHITGFVDLLQKRLGSTALDETSQRYLNIITEATKQAGKLIDDLLTFSRMGRTEMRHTTIDMNLLVREVQGDLVPETKNYQVSWQIESLPQVQGDPSMLRLVLRNLLENALKYSKTRPTTEITLGSISSEQEVVFFVRDNGIGFDMKYAHKLFGVFQRLHSDPQFEGTGVGLANVQRIIHRHGGRVWAESEIDKVATFYFSLPRRFEVSSGE
ncbi:PAS domain-containing sensor histidine kinase [Mastigocladopsis repens]|uniref:PAS domain-containing sensor histidine kinase n=1 Tax=Mastigocladopsis repens TaxID=221287 RepID=UPI0002DD9DEF|nr:PAS domain-containing sensor histidine kinase [Mastigocladopsis repens]